MTTHEIKHIEPKVVDGSGRWSLGKFAILSDGKRVAEFPYDMSGEGFDTAEQAHAKAIDWIAQQRIAA